MSEERRMLGYSVPDYPEYVIRVNDRRFSEDEIHKIIYDADVVIIGSAPESLVKIRRKEGKLIFRYSERLYKKEISNWKIIPKIVRNFVKYGTHRNEYLLCASAFALQDFAKTKEFRDKAYKWGYFPQTNVYDIGVLLANKEHNSILWAGRQIDWKHPELPVLLAERLRKAGFQFKLRIIGDGNLHDDIEQMISEKGLENFVEMLGAIPPEVVRKHMERSEVFLSTSNRKEGWGAVVNEAMNSACAVVAGSLIGSVPYLICDGKNGLIFEDENEEALFDKVKLLFCNHNKIRELGINAYHTITGCWNAEEAANRFVTLTEQISTKGSCDVFQEGPCSRAGIISDNWYRSITTK